MTPARIVEAAISRRLGCIAITDHNSAENVSAVMAAGVARGLWVIPGMEVQTIEEVHILGLFHDLWDVLAFQNVIYSALPPDRNCEEFFGQQLLLDDHDTIVGKCDRLLLASTGLSFEGVCDVISEYGGIAIPSHIDRPAFSVIRTLGFIPPEARVFAVEVSPRTSVKEATQKFPEIARFPIVISSDAHRLVDIGRGFTTLEIRERSLEGLKEALIRERGHSLA